MGSNVIHYIKSHVCLKHVSWDKGITVKHPLKDMRASVLMQLQHRGMCFRMNRWRGWLWWLPMMEVKSSGAELPAAMKVAPATSSLRWRRCRRSKRQIKSWGCGDVCTRRTCCNYKNPDLSKKQPEPWPWPRSYKCTKARMYAVT